MRVHVLECRCKGSGSRKRAFAEWHAESHSRRLRVDGEKRESFQDANVRDCIGMMVDVDTEDSTT